MARNRRPRIYDQEHSAREGEPVAVQVVAYDRNPGDTLTYTIVSGNSGGLFQIDPLTGVITRADGGAFDYETDARRYDLRVRVTDDGNPPKSRTADVTIRITDAPDAPHEITVSNLSVDENAAGAVIGTVAIADQDDDYHVVTVDDSRFEIVGDVLKLKAGETLDHETDDPVTVTITADDDDNGSLSQSFTVAVNDLNEAPTGLSLSNAAVDENVAGAVVGLITVADPDDPLEPFGMHSFSVDDARFEVVGGVLKLKDGEALDHESGGSVLVTVTATDGGGLSTSEIFEIAVNDLNEAPTAITLSDTSVDEATVGAVVGAVTVIDPDDSSAPFGSHAIVVDDDRFEVAGGVLKLKDGISLDHETGAPITVTVTATDGGGAVVAQAFDISITDVNEAPTAISLSNNTVDEVTAGATIGVLTVTDPDDPTGAFGTHSFGVNDFRFEVVDGVLKLKPGYILDHEAADNVTVTVTAIDGGGASLSQDFEIVVNDLNEAPTLSTFAFTVPEDAAIGAVVGTVPGSDPDDPGVPFGTLTYALTDDAGGRFAIDTATGAITTTAPLDHESAASFNVAVQVTDGGGLSAVRSYTINVGDVNEAPTGVTLVQAPPIVPDDAPGVYLGRIQVDDPDSRWEPFGQNTLTVTDPRFQLVQSYGSQYLKLKHGVALDFQSEPTVTVTFTATDATGSTTDLTLELEVVDTLPGKTFIPLGPLDGTNGSVIFSSDANDRYIGAGPVSTAGDLNGDGYADFVIGSPQAYDPLHPLGGAAYVLFGNPSGLPADVDVALLDGTDGFRVTGTSMFAGAGADVSTLGDINGDGFDDLLVTAVQMAATAGTGTGEYVEPIPSSFVLFGKDGGWDPSIDLSTLSGSDGFRIPATSQVGFGGLVFVRGAGDFNGDGLEDMVIGDIYGSAAAPLAGSSYVVFGKTDGWTDVFDPSGLDGTDGFRIDGVGPADLAGVAVGGGDINGDGFDDLAIGSPSWGYSYGYGYGYSSAETVYVVFGGAAAPGPTLSLADIDGTNGFRVTGITEFTEGFDLSMAGDVNGDGYDDLAISRAGFTGGEAYVVFGGAAGADVDLAALDGTNGYAISGSGIDYFGAGIDILGDVNGDGFDDLLISSYGPNDAPFGTPEYGLGAAYVVYGREDGFGGSLDLARIDGSNGFRLDGTIPDGRAGIVSAGAGDVNGDGLADILVGGVVAIPTATTSAISEVYLFNGADFSDSITGFGTSGSDMLTGTAGADSLVGAQGDDLLEGAGGADVLYGGAGNDILAVGDLDFSRIDGGSGTDTLRLDGAGQALDLTAVGDTVIEGIERLDLTGSGDNSVTLAITDLLNLSDQSNDLFVAGDAGDQVTLVGSWQNDGAITVDGVTYNTFSAAGVSAALYVEDDITFTTSV